MFSKLEILILFVMAVVTIFTKECITDKVEVILCIGFLGGNAFCVASRIAQEKRNVKRGASTS